MTPSFRKTFPDYESATRWLHERGLSSAVTFIAHTNACTIILEGNDAKRMIEASVRPKGLSREGAAP